MGAGSGLTVSDGNYTQTAGETGVQGALTASKGGIDIQDGTLYGGGSITGNLTMGGEFILQDRSDGGHNQNFFINGDYTQTALGVLDLVIGGKFADRLFIEGDALFDGTLDLSFKWVNPPQKGVPWTLITYQNLLADSRFSTVNIDLPPLLSRPGVKWWLTYGPQSLTFEMTGTPEPGTWVLFVSGLAAILCAGGLSRARQH